MIRGDDISDLRLSDLIRAFYACVRELLGLGHHLIIDHAITASYHADLLREATASHNVLLVGLDCATRLVRCDSSSRL